MSSKWILYWRIASSSAALPTGHLFARGIPAPTTSRYRSYAVKQPQSKGGLTRQGYINAVMIWNDLDPLQFNALNDIVEASITGGAIYVTLDKGDGTGLADDFVDVHGTAQPLTFEEVPRAQGRVFQAVTLTVTSIVVDNDPSNVL